MLHATTSETKTETAQSKSQLMPMPERQLHPYSFGAAGAYSLNGAGNAASVRAPEAQQRQTLAGMQATHGNQAVLRMLHNSPQAPVKVALLRPSQGGMVQCKSSNPHAVIGNSFPVIQLEADPTPPQGVL